jgi:chemotaxis response regulator CheB
MGHGALDAVNTPALGTDGQMTGAQALLRKIEIIGHLISRPALMSPAAGDIAALPPAKGRLPLVVLGASTGGPAALADILSRLPAVVNAGIVITQHIGKEFAHELALWLGTNCRLQVRVATPGCRPEAGVVWLAGTNDHLVLTKHGTLEYCVEPVECFYRPSVDVFFKSVAAHGAPHGVAILLTGMGRDGGEGLLALRRCGWHTIAQDKATSIVYGMPRAAAELGAAERILPLSDIADALMRGLNNRSRP